MAIMGVFVHTACAAAKKAAAFLGRKARRLGETLFYAFAVAIKSFILLSWFVVLTLAS